MKLGVNIDHVATLRQARGVDYPSVAEAAALCEKSGAHGITVHLREDRRHIQDADVYDLRGKIETCLNLEMADSDEIIEIALEVRPDEACLVPEKRQELTTEGGLNVAGCRCRITETVKRLLAAGVRPSLFIDPSPEQIEACAGTGAPCIELHTGAFCNAAGDEAQRELDRLIKGAEFARSRGLQVNAGHGINIWNIDSVLRVPHIDTFNIGHSIIARSVFIGLENAVKEILRKIEKDVT